VFFSNSSLSFVSDFGICWRFYILNFWYRVLWQMSDLFMHVESFVSTINYNTVRTFEHGAMKQTECTIIRDVRPTKALLTFLLLTKYPSIIKRSCCAKRPPIKHRVSYGTI
jgi:hypothetical protein